MLRRTFFCLLLTISLRLSAQPTMEYYRDFVGRYESTRISTVFEALQAATSGEQRDAIVFLYAYMAWPDVLNYPADFYLKQTAASVRARHATAWAASVPDREWFHFVLPIRVNNEHLDRFRELYYDELAARVKGLSMAEAALEVNHWCHEHLTYQPSDARTSSPLTSLKTATGRCGEESTLTVAALRAVGIPARQVYTPRWAHTDDNHAWVEAWIDGKWHFMGACEPAPQLDVAWFNQPAARGMLMNTTVLGRYKGPEDVIVQKERQTTINVTENYAPVARAYVKVVDGKGTAVPDASVSFRLYNYAEFYPVFQTKTASDGTASMLAGRGDMIVWASKDGTYGFEKVSVGREDTVVVALSHRDGDAYETDLEIVPPPESNSLPVVDAKAQTACNKRLAEEDALRAKYVASFPTDKAIARFCHKYGYPSDRVIPLIHNSKGNYDSLFRMLAQWGQPTSLTFCGIRQEERIWLLDLLETLTEKDLRDLPEETVAGHMAVLESQELTDSLDLPLDDYGQMVRKYVLSPRIAMESLSDWRRAFCDSIPQDIRTMLRQHPTKVVDFVNMWPTLPTDESTRYINVWPERAARMLPIDSYSKQLFFVALARTVGLPARIDEVTGRVAYFADGWRTVEFEHKEVGAKVDAAGLKLAFAPTDVVTNPKYYTHFTLCRLENGQPQLLEYPEEATCESTFQSGAPVEKGNYFLISGTRLASGSVLAHVSAFALRHDTTVSLQLNRDDRKVSVIGSYNAENLYYDIESGAEKSVLSTTGRGFFVVGLLKASDEPSTHLLHDLEQEKEALEAWGRTILLLFPNEADYKAFENRRSEYPNLPKNVRFGIDLNGASVADVLANEWVRAKQLPAIVVADSFNRIVFGVQGYTIGIGSQLRRVISQL
ncbi:MAG: transglutaminase domain-containing protein [Alloprevotella sp.]|nr:transglutaminase domain-containing protein [Alloprevotella sp.]MBR1387978.1 transglutaminase domain-containing protein [Alloprevotella sp.]